MSIIAEKIYEAVKTLPDQDAAEVFDFVALLDIIINLFIPFQQ